MPVGGVQIVAYKSERAAYSGAVHLRSKSKEIIVLNFLEPMPRVSSLSSKERRNYQHADGDKMGIRAAK